MNRFSLPSVARYYARRRSSRPGAAGELVARTAAERREAEAEEERAAEPNAGADEGDLGE
jgi:hypothetical protein